jgi:hypothetical protein
MSRPEFNALRFANLKDPNRSVCEHCDRTYLQTLAIDGTDMTITVKMSCDPCANMAQRLDELARFGFKLQDQLRAEQGKRETVAGADRIKKLEKMLEAQRADWAVAVRKAKREIGEIRRENGKR